MDKKYFLFFIILLISFSFNISFGTTIIENSSISFSVNDVANDYIFKNSSVSMISNAIISYSSFQNYSNLTINYNSSNDKPRLEYCNFTNAKINSSSKNATILGGKISYSDVYNGSADANLSIYRVNIDNSEMSASQVYNSIVSISIIAHYSQVYNSSISYSHMLDGSQIYNSSISYSKMWAGSQVYNSSISNSTMLDDSQVYNSSISYLNMLDGSQIYNSSISYLKMWDGSQVYNSSISNSNMWDGSQVYNSSISYSNMWAGSQVYNSSILNSNMYESSQVYNSTISNSTIKEYSKVNNSNISNSTIMNYSQIYNSSISNSTMRGYSQVNNSNISNSNMWAYSQVYNSIVSNLNMYESSQVYNSTISNSTIKEYSKVNNSNISNSNMYDYSQVYNSSILNLTMYDYSQVYNSNISNLLIYSTNIFTSNLSGLIRNIDASYINSSFNNANITGKLKIDPTNITNSYLYDCELTLQGQYNNLSNNVINNCTIIINGTNNSIYNNIITNSNIYELDRTFNTTWQNNTISNVYIGSVNILQDKQILSINTTREGVTYTFRFNFTGGTPKNVTLGISNGTYQTNYTMNKDINNQLANYYNYTTNFENSNKVYNYTFYWSDSYNNYSIFWGNFTNYNFNISTSGSVKILTANFYDEATETDITTGVNSTILINMLDEPYEQYTINTTGAISLNMTPAIFSRYADIRIQYLKSGYATREYYLINSTLSNSTLITLKLYDGSNTSVTPILISVKDKTLSTLDSIYIYVQRLMKDNTYQTIAMGKTNDIGNDILYLYPYPQFYKFIFVNNSGAILKTTDPMKLVSDSITFYLDTFSASNKIYDLIENVNIAVNYINSSNTIIAALVAPSGLYNEYCLDVYQHSSVSKFRVCHSCDTGSAISFSCVLPDNSSYYSINVYGLGSFGNLFSGFLDLRGATNTLSFGNYGVYLTLILTLTIGLAGIFDPVASVILYFAAIVVGSLIGFLNIPYGLLVTLGVVAGVIIWRVRN